MGLPDPPPAVAGAFGAHAVYLARFAGWLAGPGVGHGLLGPREVPRLWERHVLNCAVVASEIPEGSLVCDVGSGAGLPGLVLAITRPDLQIVLVEPLLRRTQFLREVIEDLGLEQVDVLRARAEDLVGAVQADVVTARAVAPLERLMGWGLPLVAPGGVMLAIKGASAADELRLSKPSWRRLGVQSVEILHLGSGVVDPPATVVRVRVDGGRHASPRSTAGPVDRPSNVRRRGPGARGTSGARRGSGPHG
ncbi:MAG: 16S rRNA (guanine(527)-N(7))-methyltransferase RsmG [Actinomycetes bacterium]